MQKKWVYSALLALVLFMLFLTSELLHQGYPKGGDTIGLYDLLLNTVDALKILFSTGELKLWSPDYYLGFPMFFFYAPLPYVFLATLSLATGISPLFLFTLSIVILFSSLPLVFYFSARLLDFEEEAALCIALFSTALSSSIGYGLEYSAFFTIGLYSQLWGVFFLPLAIAFAYRYFVLQKSRLFFPVFFLFLTFTSHILSGVVAVLSAGLLALCCLFFSKNIGTTRKENLLQATMVFFLFLLSISFLIIPYLLNKEYFSNVPLDVAAKLEGYGFLPIMKLLFTGKLLDESSFFRLPILTLLFFLGLILSFFWKSWKERHSFFSLYLLLLFAASILFVSGKSSFGFLAYIPVLSILETFRFLTLFHIAALFYIGIALFWIFSSVKQQKIALLKKILLLALVFLFLTIPIFSERIKTFQEKEFTLDFADYHSYWNIATAMKESSLHGRIFVLPESELYSKFEALHALPFLTGNPILTSLTIGSHDSLSAYYVSLPLPLELYDLLGVDFILTAKESASEENENELKELTLYIPEQPPGYFSVVSAPFQLNATPVAAREAVLTWLLSPLSVSDNFMEIGSFDTAREGAVLFTDIENRNLLTYTEEGPEDYTHVVPTVDLEEKSPVVTIIAANETFETPLYYYFLDYSEQNETKKECGSVVGETNSRGEYHATVFANKTDCFVVLKVTYHPEWQVFVDGAEKKLVMLSPSFMGVAVATGEHDVVFSYEVFWYRKILFVVPVVLFLLLWFWKKGIASDFTKNI